MKVIKRSGEEVEFDSAKIFNAIKKANAEIVDQKNDGLSDQSINRIVETITMHCKNMKHIPSIENIQDLVEEQLVLFGKFKLAKRYILYRYEHALSRAGGGDELDKRIFSIVECKSQDIKDENSNKNPIIIPTQRDYIAGEASKYLSVKYLIDKDILDAHNKGIIHFHDMDYFVQHSHNCCLINLEDMLQNGTVISGTKIDKPHSFSTACTVATQIIAQVASSQYGGQTISLAHLSPFVEETRKKLRNKLSMFKDKLGDETFDELIETLTNDDIERGVQTIQYQLITLWTSNGWWMLGRCKTA